MEQSKLLDSIGTAQMERELQTSILTIAKKTSDEMKENSGIEASLSEDDIRDYMSLVIKELKRSN
jgi:cytochrome c553